MHYGKWFVCRRGCNIRNASYTDEFNWEDIYDESRDIHGLIEFLELKIRLPRKRRAAKAPAQDLAFEAPNESLDIRPGLGKGQSRWKSQPASSPNKRYVPR
jgi:origin recognition complex subunit 1